MKQICRSCIIVGLVSMGLAVLNASGTFLSLEALNAFIRCIIPLQAITLTIFSLFNATPEHQNLTIFCSVISYILSTILIISGIGTIWMKSWGRTFGKMYAIGMFFIAILGMPSILVYFAKEFYAIEKYEKYGFLGGIIYGGALAYLIILVLNLLYPTILLVFYSRPKIKEKFAAKS